jgi:hypothetical protein
MNDLLDVDKLAAKSGTSIHCKCFFFMPSLSSSQLHVYTQHTQSAMKRSREDAFPVAGDNTTTVTNNGPAAMKRSRIEAPCTLPCRVGFIRCVLASSLFTRSCHRF